jgi:hypothetical protein
MLSYLDALGDWVTAKRADLDRVDARVGMNGTQEGIADMTTIMTVWQAVDTRYKDLVRVWDSGRVVDADLKKLATMIWSNLNDMLTPGTSLGTGGGLAVSLPEACRMLEALIIQLNARFQLAQVPTELSTRVQALRAQMVRIRDQANLDPAPVQSLTEPAVADLASDIGDLIAKSDQGADIGGILGPLEIRAARLERDLIVSHAQRAQLSTQITQVNAQRSALIDKEKQVSALVATTQASVAPAPKYAVPHVDALGDVPRTGPELTAYMARLNQVNAALDQVRRANETALKTRDDLVARAKKARETLPQTPLTASLATQIADLFTRSPLPVDVLTALVDAYEASGRHA